MVIAIIALCNNLILLYVNQHSFLIIKICIDIDVILTSRMPVPSASDVAYRPIQGLLVGPFLCTEQSLW